MGDRSESNSTNICTPWLIIHVACLSSSYVACIWSCKRGTPIPTARLIRSLIHQEVFMQPRDGFITRSWMNLGTGASRRLSILGSRHRMKLSRRSVTRPTPRGLTWMSSHGREGVWASWRLHRLSWRLRVRVSLLLLGSRESLKLDELTPWLQAGHWILKDAQDKCCSRAVVSLKIVLDIYLCIVAAIQIRAGSIQWELGAEPVVVFNSVVDGSKSIYNPIFVSQILPTHPQSRHEFDFYYDNNVCGDTVNETWDNWP